MKTKAATLYKRYSFVIPSALPLTTFLRHRKKPHGRGIVDVVWYDLNGTPERGREHTYVNLTSRSSYKTLGNTKVFIYASKN